MMVGQYIAILADDNTGTQARQQSLVLGQFITKKLTKERIGHQGMLFPGDDP